MTNLESDVIGCFKYFIEPPILTKESRFLFLEGNLGCRVKGFQSVDGNFEVKIIIPIDFPKKLPIVIEKSDKIPRLKDFHINYEGVCCLGTRIALYDFMHQNKITSFTQFLEQVVIIHFFQINYALKNNGKWFSETEEHNTVGIIHSYMRVFEITEEKLRELIFRKFRKHTKCLCGSGKRYDKCHGKYIPVEQVQSDFEEIEKYYQELQVSSMNGIPIKIKNLGNNVLQKGPISQRRY